jgi:hypothetical protein
MPHFSVAVTGFKHGVLVSTLMVAAWMTALETRAQPASPQASGLGQVFQGSSGAALPGFIRRDSAQGRREATSLGTGAATEPGHVLIIWDDTPSAIAGLQWLMDSYQLKPQQAVKLDALGAAVALFVLVPVENATKLAQALATDQPNWWVAPNVRYASAAPKLPLVDPLGLVGGAVDESTPSFLSQGDNQARYPSALPLGKSSRLVSVLRLLPQGDSVSDTYTVLRAVDALVTEGFRRIHLAVKTNQDPVIDRAIQAFANRGVQIEPAP